jgi:hypothetical protein
MEAEEKGRTEEMRNTYKILVGMSEDQRPLGILWRKLRITLK